MKTFYKIIYTTIFYLIFSGSAFAEDGYDLWLRYNKIDDVNWLETYKTDATKIIMQGSNDILIAAREELKHGLDGLLGQTTAFKCSKIKDGSIIIGTPYSSKIIEKLNLSLAKNKEAYKIISTTIKKKKVIIIASNGDIGVMYGVFHLLRLMQTNQPIKHLNISEEPKINLRVLNHWDDLGGNIERGYAGKTIWKWDELPLQISPRYKDYARACASVGINGAVLNNVNNHDNMKILTSEYIQKIAVLANVFRAYGVKIYITPYFDAPQQLGGLTTSSPFDENVIKWWKDKADEIYQAIPDFGGFLVKANSEGEAGPKDYGATHVDGANCIAAALAPHGGYLMWRAFVYDNKDPDRMKRAYLEFKGFDGQFRNNVIIQAKNGPYDFQPREPIHPLFGGLPKSNMGMEFQITQEYLGQDKHLVYLAPYYKEVLDFDTYAKGEGSTVAKVIDGSVYNNKITSIAGVSNIGNDKNWTRHPFHQANWYAFGRLAWDHTLSSDAIANEWARMTWSNKKQVVSTVTTMMAGSREATVNYMTPLGMCGLFCMGSQYFGETHYGPCPSQNRFPERPDWNAVYWHNADSTNIGFDRTDKGSDFVGLYHPQVRDRYNNIETTPAKYLLAFHRVSWDYVIPSTNRTVWNELNYRYCIGNEYVENLMTQWNSLSDYIDSERFGLVNEKLKVHKENAAIWRSEVLGYFSSLNGKPIADCEE